MTQDQVIILLLKITLITGFVSIIGWVAVYTRLTAWYHDVIGRTLVVKSLLIAGLLVPSTLSLFFHLTRFDSRVAAWANVVLIGAITPVMWWRTAVWLKIGREDRNSEREDSEQPPLPATSANQGGLIRRYVTEVPAHEQAESHRYVVHFPPHPARKDDPHYADFDHYHRKTRATARCFIGERVGYGDCRDAKGDPSPPPDGGGEQPGLELHHAHVEFSLQNGISLAALEADYPGISDPSQVGDWVESAQNFRWLCCHHHRGSAGAHTAAHSDWEGSQYVLGLISKA